MFSLVSPFIFSAVYPFVFKTVTWAVKAEEIGSTAGPTNSELCFSCESAVSTAHREESLLASQGPSEMGVPRLPSGRGRAAAPLGWSAGRAGRALGRQRERLWPSPGVLPSHPWNTLAPGPGAAGLCWRKGDLWKSAFVLLI